MPSPLVVIWKAPSLRLACTRRASSRPLVGVTRRERVRRPHPWHCAPATGLLERLAPGLRQVLLQDQPGLLVPVVLVPEENRAMTRRIEYDRCHWAPAPHDEL